MQGLARPVPTAAFRGSAVVGKLRRGAALSVRGRNGPLTVSAKAGARIIVALPVCHPIGNAALPMRGCVDWTRRCSGASHVGLQAATSASPGVGAAVPAAVLTNDDLGKLVDTNDEWISTRTGIRQRHIISQGESITSLAADACNKALAMAKVDAKDVNLILLCTSSPEDAFGGACLVQAAIGASNAAAFDLTAACSGFVLGVVSAVQYIRGGGMKNVLVIGADALSRHVDWRDRGTCILFGDGCGAVLVQAHEGDCCLMGYDLNSDGTGNKHLTAAFCGQGSDKPHSEKASDAAAYANIHMNGQEVFKFAVRSVPASLTRTLENAGKDASAIDWLVMHQANQRILDAVAQRFNIAQERVVSNIAKYGNTSAASIPLALDEAVRDGKVKKGDVIATAGFGAGLSWASALLRWG